MLIGCSANEKTSTPQKINKEASKDLNKEVESEQNSVDTKLSNEELISKKPQYEAKLHQFLDSFSGGFYTSDIKQFEHYKQNSKFKEYVDMLLSLGYGIEQAEGYYYLYVGEAVGYKDGPDAEEAITNKSNTEKSNALLETNNKNYYKFKPNVNVRFDIDGDDSEENVVYDTVNGKLKVSGYDPIDIDTMLAETNYFIIIKFTDKYNSKLNMIGILDNGPSNDYVTDLYSIIGTGGQKILTSVGAVPGKIVTPSKYDEKNMDDFNYKAVLYEGRGIEAPVRLTLHNNLQTWFGRSMFTYYGTYCSLIDNTAKYEEDYETRVELSVKRDVAAYSDKDFNSDRFIIKSGQKVHLLATDNKEWIGMLADDETMGWVNAKDVTKINFSDFPVFD